MIWVSSVPKWILLSTPGFRTPCTGDQGFVLIPLGSGKGATDYTVVTLKIKVILPEENGFIQE